MVVTSRLPYYYSLLRLDKPIGILLLLWPSLWSLWIAAQGWPDLKILTIFVAGVILMRCAGCAINDFADRDFDGYVQRTQSRPIAMGHITSKEALILFVGLSLLALLLVLQLNRLTIYLSFPAIILVVIYPFVKRFLPIPQLVLGFAFAWSVPMAFTATQAMIPKQAWLLFAAAVIWPVAYDTMYAMVDRDDDIKLKLKSTAILFGRFDVLIISLLQLLFALFVLQLAIELRLSVAFYGFFWLAVVLLFYQIYLIKERQRQCCFRAFLTSNWVGLSIWLGLVAHYNLSLLS